MSHFEAMKSDLEELLRLVRESERYCQCVALCPDLASDETHQKEVKREHRINELLHKFGVIA